eukprot:678960-Amphidinium_carterae.1
MFQSIIACGKCVCVCVFKAQGYCIQCDTRFVAHVILKANVLGSFSLYNLRVDSDQKWALVSEKSGHRISPVIACQVPRHIATHKSDVLPPEPRLPRYASGQAVRESIACCSGERQASLAWKNLKVKRGADVERE